MGMGIGRVLAAILGGFGEGAVKGYSYEQEEKDRKLRLDQLEEDRQARRGEAEHRLALEEHDRQVQENERARRESERQAAADFVQSLPEGPIRQAAQAAYNGIHGLQPNDFQAAPSQDELHNTTEQELPEALRAAFHANGHKGPSGGFKPDDFLSPEQLTAKEAADAARKRSDTLATYRGEREIDKQYKTPITLTDDPALPTGVKSYLASLPSKYQGDYAGAFGEFQSALPRLLQDHPHLDVSKARQAFDELFPANAVPARPTAGSAAINDIFNNNPQGATPAPVGSTPITRRTPPQAAAAPAAGVTDADLETIARSVLASNGMAVTPDTVRMFVARNRARLQQQILQARGTASR
jgi:hypothetical protein